MPSATRLTKVSTAITTSRCRGGAELTYQRDVAGAGASACVTATSGMETIPEKVRCRVYLKATFGRFMLVIKRRNDSRCQTVSPGSYDLPVKAHVRYMSVIAARHAGRPTIVRSGIAGSPCGEQLAEFVVDSL